MHLNLTFRNPVRLHRTRTILSTSSSKRLTSSEPLYPRSLNPDDLRASVEAPRPPRSFSIFTSLLAKPVREKARESKRGRVGGRASQTASMTLGSRLDDFWTTSKPTAAGLSKQPGDALKDWSSFIGIITAIVGNVFIALALNVQRYAHVRLRRERTWSKHKARAAFKRSSVEHACETYGTVDSNSQSLENRERGRSIFYESDRGQENLDEDLTGAHTPLCRMACSPAPEPECGAAGSDNSNNYTSTYLKSPYWWLGQVLITLGEAGNFLAYGFAPASIVSPLGVVALISNCIIAPVMFHEHFRGRDFWGLFTAVSGVVTVVLSANQKETQLGPHEILRAISALAFKVYLGVTVLLILSLMMMSSRFGGRTILIDLGLVGLFGMLGTSLQLFIHKRADETSAGGYTALATKALSSMLSSTLWRAFATPVTYVLIFILGATAVMQIRYVNRALQRFDSTQVIPIQFVLFTLFVILGSAILYRDFENTTGQQAGKFIGGCFLTFFGVFLITKGRQPLDDEIDELFGADGAEGPIGLSYRARDHPYLTQSPTPQQEGSENLSEFSSPETVESRRLHVPSSSTASQSLSSANFGPSKKDAFAIPRRPKQKPRGTSAPLLAGLSGPPEDFQNADSDMLLPSLSRSVTTMPMREARASNSYLADRAITDRHKPLLARATHRFNRMYFSPSPFSSTVRTVMKDAFPRSESGNSPQE